MRAGGTGGLFTSEDHHPINTANGQCPMANAATRLIYQQSDLIVPTFRNPTYRHRRGRIRLEPELAAGR